MNLELGEKYDDLAATATFHEWVSKLGYKATLSPDGKIVIVRGYNIDFEIHFRSGRSIKRLIMRCHFRSNAEGADMPGRYELANDFNSRFNIASFWFDTDGHLNCQFVLPFEERLTPGLWQYFISFCEASVTSVLHQRADDLRPFMA
jgi:Putative bacterial sensory transduction regulator